MKSLLIRTTSLFAALLFSFLSLKAQADHFIYIQSDNHQPFYIRINNDIFSSNEEGFIILSKLKHGDLSFTLGFPKNLFPASNYQLEIGDNDQGFQLKKMTEKNWALYDLKSGDLLTAAATIQPATYEIIKTNDEFSNTLADASHTPSIKEIKVLKDSGTLIVSENNNNPKKKEKQKVQQDKPQEDISKDSARTDITNSSASSVTSIDETITKSSSRQDPSGYYSEYLIVTNGVTEKVDMMIPVTTSQDVKIVEVPVSKPQNAETTLVSSNESAIVEAVKPAPVSKCTTNASEQDFLQLRRKMTAQDNETQMMEVANKAFGELCYTSMQVKNLAVLFLSSENRLMFLQMVFPSVIDNQNYASLSVLFDDPAFQTRFKSIFH